MIKKVEFKVGLFIVITFLLIAAGLTYLAYSKGLFAKEYTYTLSSKSGEDLIEGMPILFSGIKIGKVEKLELNEQGIVLIKIKIPERHVKWLRTNSTFSLNKPLIGSPRLVVTTENLNTPALSSRDVREITTINDINETIKKVQPIIEKVDKVVANVERITANIAKKDSFIEMALGKPESVQSVHETLGKVRDILVKTDDQMYGDNGAIPLIRKILKDLLVKLEKINAAVDNVVKISGDAADSTKDLKLLRAEIDATVNSIGNLVNELDKKMPFKKEPEIKLP
jgi:phospholipid/cholesterol/gamma-HCH transport system substrate-binding protein